MAPLHRNTDKPLTIPLVSVVIPTLGGRQIVDTIAQLNRGTVRPSEILICIPEGNVSNVDDLSFDNVRIVPTSCRGQVAQRAVGFGLASCQLVMQLDDDILLELNAVEELVSGVLSLGHGNTVGPVFVNQVTGLPLSRIHKGLKGFFTNIYETAIRGLPWGRQRMGVMSSIGTCGSVDPDCCSEALYRTDWLPGGCSLSFREELIAEAFYPCKGKAYTEDVVHSILRAKRGIVHHIATRAHAAILPPERSVTFRSAIAEVEARLYAAQLLGGSRVRALFAAVMDILRRQVVALFVR
jgi:hypothetical protein